MRKAVADRGPPATRKRLTDLRPLGSTPGEPANRPEKVLTAFQIAVNAFLWLGRCLFGDFDDARQIALLCQELYGVYVGRVRGDGHPYPISLSNYAEVSHDMNTYLSPECHTNSQRTSEYYADQREGCWSHRNALWTV